MKFSAAAPTALALLASLALPAAGNTVWHSPLNMTTAEAGLSVNPSCCPSTAMEIIAALPGDLQWVDIPLVAPSQQSIDSVTVCYELSNPASFISQVRLTLMNEPDAAFVHHDDGTDLTSATPACYTSFVGGLVPTGTLTLSLRLNYAQSGDRIKIGAVGLSVSGGDCVPPGQGKGKGKGPCGL